MNRDQLSKEMQEQIRKSVLSYSIFRPESAVVIARTTKNGSSAIATVGTMP